MDATGNFYQNAKNKAPERYCLSRDSTETQRLQNQHEYLKRVLNRRSPLPSSIEEDLDEVDAVLDVAAGSLIWTLDLSRTLRQKPMNSTNTTGSSSSDPNPIKLYATDLSASQFPSQSILSSHGISTFVHDIRKPFPVHLRGKFGLIHMRLLVFALNECEWMAALSNLRPLLKPNGKLVLVDLNINWYSPHKPLPTDWKYIPPDPNSKHRGQNYSWIENFDEMIHRTLVEKEDFVPDLVHRLPYLLARAGFTVLSRSPFVTPIGAMCGSYPGPLGQDVSREGECTVRIVMRVWDAVSRRILELEREGHHSSRSKSSKDHTDEYESEPWRIRSESDRQMFLTQLEKRLRLDGVLAVWVEVVASVT